MAAREATITLYVTIHDDSVPLDQVKSAAINAVDALDRGRLLDVDRAGIVARPS